MLPNTKFSFYFSLSHPKHASPSAPHLSQSDQNRCARALPKHLISLNFKARFGDQKFHPMPMSNLPFLTIIFCFQFQLPTESHFFLSPKSAKIGVRKDPPKKHISLNSEPGLVTKNCTRCRCETFHCSEIAFSFFSNPSQPIHTSSSAPYRPQSDTIRSAQGYLKNTFL